MKKLYLLVLATALAGCGAATPAPEAAEPAAGEPTVVAAASEVMPTAVPATGAITVSDVWARTSPMEAANGAAYMVITNAGATDDKLLGAMAGVSDAVEIHETKEVGGMMTMAPVDFIAVPAGGTAELQPGGYHVMLIGLKSPLEAGQTFPLTLRFEQAGDIEVQAEVRAE